MAFDNPTNRGRVERITEILDLIAHSGMSNRTPTPELADMLRPVVSKLISLGAIDGAKREITSGGEPLKGITLHPHEVLRQGPPQREPGWYSIYKAAQEAPLPDLVNALTVIAGRITEAMQEDAA